VDLRVTGLMQANQAVASLRSSAARQSALQQAIATGARVRQPSDDPVAYLGARRADALNDRLAVYQTTTGDATNDLNASVSALQDGSQLLTQASSLASQGINASTDPSSYGALASQVDSLIDRMLALGNTQVDGRYLYGGTATQTPPFAVTTRGVDGRPTAISYQGAADRARALIGPGQTADTHYAGSQVFQSGGADVFQALISLRDTLNDTSLSPTARAAALTQQMGQLQTARTAVLQTVGEQSATLESLQAVQTRLSDVQLSAQARSGDLVSTDYASAVIRLQEEQTTYQAALSMAAKTFSTGLMDFLR
jgi:flagellar hook-associated protein 3 FlgL